MTIFRFSVLLLSSVAWVSGAALAQTVPGSAEAGRVQQDRTEQKLPTVQKGDVDVQAAPAIAAPAGAEKITLVLADVTFEGATVYAERTLTGLYKSMVGQTITLADVYGLAAQLTAKYRNDGYILTQVVVPPQTIDGGHVKLQIVEGYIDAVMLDGTLTPSEHKTVMHYAERAKATKPLNMRDLERALLSINDLPGLSARGVLSPSPTQLGAADLTVMIGPRDKFEGRMGLDNFGSRYLGSWETNAGVFANSVLGLNERLGAQVVYAPNEDLHRELAYGELSYDQPIGPYGTQLELRGSYSGTEPGFTLDELNVNGRSLFWSAKINQPIIQTRNLGFSVYGLFDWRNTKTTSDIDTARQDMVRAVRGGAQFTAVDTLLGVASNTLNLEIAQGLDVLGASQEGDTGLSRTLGDPTFTTLSGEYQRLQRVTNGVNVLVAGKGQMASDALLSSEEFGVGGSSYGRAYDPSEIVGDSGIAAKLEVQWREPVALPSSYLDTYQVYGFVDGGTVWNTDATNAGDKRSSLSSTGVGVRASLRHGTQGGAYVAVPLTRDVETQDDRGPRFFMNVSQSF